MADRKEKRSIVSISSSSSSSDEESESEGDDCDYQDEEVEEISQGASDSRNEDGDDDEDNDDDDDDESMFKRVICFLQEGNDLVALRLKHCKAYLRWYGLRLAGTKSVCIQRIKEHWRIKGGNGETLYPRSSFAIDCTGDVCKGDVVLFTQKVYAKFNKARRHGKLLGRRTVAGRVVKESYGSAKQQHTFTVEVLWSKGIKKLPTLFPLLVKGRNLYKLKTFRQHWHNEAERLEVLDEKHKRGAAARSVRRMKKSKILSAKEAVKHHTHSHHTRPSQTRTIAELQKTKQVEGCRKNENWVNHCHVVSPSRHLNRITSVRLDGSKTSWRHRRNEHVSLSMEPTLQSYTRQYPYLSQRELQHVGVPSNFSGYDTGSTSTVLTHLPFRHYAEAAPMPISQYQGFNHGHATYHDYSSSRYHFETRHRNHFPDLNNTDSLLQQLPHLEETIEQNMRGFQYFHH